MSSDLDRSSGWEGPAPGDGLRGPSWVPIFGRVLIVFGILLTWPMALLIAFVNVYGDCFDTEAACQQVWVLAGERAYGTFGLCIVLTAVAIVASIWFGRRSLGALLVASLVAGGLALLATVAPYSIPYLPGGLLLIAPAIMCFVVASVAGLPQRRTAETRPASP